jgi:hypothetical protein
MLTFAAILDAVAAALDDLEAAESIASVRHLAASIRRRSIVV